MPSWPNSNESSNDDECMNEYNNMQMEYFETPDMVIDPSFCGLVVESECKCIMHRQRPGWLVAFEDTQTGRRFIGCAATDGVSCGVLEWVDAPWPVILQRCLTKMWDMYHEENLGRVQDKEAYGIEVAKLNKELDSLGNQYSELVDDVSKLFDYQDGQKSHGMENTSQAINELKEKKQYLEEQAKIEVQMKKLKLKKEQRYAMTPRYS
ncbi:hypothetical protein ZWY2020_036112 [Hordeum vulgare]|nr:hypothetical protein ZWY2020_036112 [Hordeum vulgare]